MPQTCPPEGNTGLPLSLTGYLLQTNLNFIKSEGTAELKANPRRSYPSIGNNLTFNEQSTTTMRVNGIVHSLQYVQIFRTFNNTYYPSTNLPIAEMTLWYKSPRSDSIILTCVPIFFNNAPANNDGGNYLAAALIADASATYKGSIGDVYGNKSINYETCIQYGTNPTQLSGLPVKVFVFLEGIIINSATNTRFMQRNAQMLNFGFPASMLPDPSMKTVQRPGDPPALDTSSGNLRIVYSTQLTTSSDLFKDRFRYYEKTFLVSSQEQKKKSASAFKCIPIDTKKNLKMINGKLVVNLEEDDIAAAGSLEDIAAQQKLAVEKPTDTKDIASTAATVVGAVVGTAIASALLWLVVRNIIRKPE